MERWVSGGARDEPFMKLWTTVSDWNLKISSTDPSGSFALTDSFSGLNHLRQNLSENMRISAPLTSYIKHICVRFPWHNKTHQLDSSYSSTQTSQSDSQACDSIQFQLNSHFFIWETQTGFGNPEQQKPRASQHRWWHEDSLIVEMNTEHYLNGSNGSYLTWI